MDTPDDIKKIMPEQPSRASARRYMAWIMLLAALQAVGVFAVAGFGGAVPWQALTAVNALVIGAFVIVRSGTTLDLKHITENISKVMVARYGNG